MAIVNVGDEAPDFDLPAVVGNIKQRVKLSDYRGKKNVVLVFYPADWTPVCSAELPAFNAELEKFAGYGAEVVGISVKAGDAVTKGEAVVVLEAMKMENALVAPCDGIVQAIKLKSGDTVAKGAVLCVIA